MRGYQIISKALLEPPKGRMAPHGILATPAVPEILVILTDFGATLADFLRPDPLSVSFPYINFTDFDGIYAGGTPHKFSWNPSVIEEWPGDGGGVVRRPTVQPNIAARSPTTAVMHAILVLVVGQQRTTTSVFSMPSGSQSKHNRTQRTRAAQARLLILDRPMPYDVVLIAQVEGTNACRQCLYIMTLVNKPTPDF